MTCKEAESMVMPYINDELTDKQLASFLEHIESCQSCYEELEVYYTLYAGLKQLDGENEGQDMRGILEEALHASQLRVRGRHILNFCFVASQAAAIAVLVAMIVMEMIRR